VIPEIEVQMKMRRKTWLAVAVFAVVIPAASCDRAGSGVDTQALAGAWSLQGYAMQGVEQANVSGLMVVRNDRFGIVYTMSTGDSLSGRGHAGAYSLDGDQLTFDVTWWVEDVGGEARVMSSEQATAEAALDGDILQLNFASGSVQRWQRVERGSVPDRSGAWPLESVRVDGERRDVDGVLLLSGDRFAAVYALGSGTDPADMYAHGGIMTGPTQEVELVSRYVVAAVDGDGYVFNVEQGENGAVPGAAAVLLSTAEGESFRLRR
jgi:hypothetical protein